MVCNCNPSPNIFVLPPTEGWTGTSWGGYKEVYRDKENSMCFRILYLAAGHQIPLDRHDKRSEVWWIPCEQTEYELTIAEENTIMRGRRRVDIPKGIMHRIRNRSSFPLEIYETQYGECIESDKLKQYDQHKR